MSLPTRLVHCSSWVVGIRESSPSRGIVAHTGTSTASEARESDLKGQRWTSTSALATTGVRHGYIGASSKRTRIPLSFEGRGGSHSCGRCPIPLDLSPRSHYSMPSAGALYLTYYTVIQCQEYCNTILELVESNVLEVHHDHFIGPLFLLCAPFALFRNGC